MKICNTKAPSVVWRGLFDFFILRIRRALAPRWVKIIAGVKTGPITGRQIFTEGIEPWKTSIALGIMKDRLESGERRRRPNELPCPCQCIMVPGMFPQLRVHQDHPSECQCGPEMFRKGSLDQAIEAEGIILARELQSILLTWGFAPRHLDEEASRSMLFSYLDFSSNVKSGGTAAQDS